MHGLEQPTPLPPPPLFWMGQSNMTPSTESGLQPAEASVDTAGSVWPVTSDCVAVAASMLGEGGGWDGLAPSRATCDHANPIHQSELIRSDRFVRPYHWDNVLGTETMGRGEFLMLETYKPTPIFTTMAIQSTAASGQ